MHDLLPSSPLLSAFVIASLVLAVTPGPGVLYIVTRSLVQGRRVGLASVAGVAAGNLCNACGAAFGLAALFAVSAPAFAVVKYAGALYLIYLGVRTLRAPRADRGIAVPDPAPLARVFRDGFAVALLNPKTALFFAAFLPQFMTAAAPPLLQSMLLGSLFVAIAAVTDTLYAFGASAVAAPLAHASGIWAFGRYLTAGTFVGLGILAAFTGTGGEK